MPKNTKKKSRSSAAKARASANPMGANVPVDPVEQESKARSLKIIHLLNGSATDRREACRAIAHFLQNEAEAVAPGTKHKSTLAELLVSNGVIKAILPLLYSIDLSTSITAAGALRNLSVYGGEAVCDKIVASDAMTTLLGLLNHPNVTKAKSEQRIDLLTQALATVSNLCEESEVATSRFNQESAVTELFTTMNACVSQPEPGTETLLSEAVSLLATISDSNELLTKRLASNQSMVQFLLLLMKHSCEPAAPGKVFVSPKVGVAAAGVLLSAIPSNENAMKAVFLTLAHHLQLNYFISLGSLTENLLKDKAQLGAAVAEIEAKNKERQKRGGQDDADEDMQETLKADTSEAAEPSASASETAPVAPMDGTSDEKEEKKAGKKKGKKKNNKDDEAALSEKDPVLELNAQFSRGVDQKVARWKESVEAVKEALEIIANLVTRDGDDDEKESKNLPANWNLLLQAKPPVLISVIDKLKLRLSPHGSDNEYEKTQQKMLQALSTVMSAHELHSVVTQFDFTRVAALDTLSNMAMHFPIKVLGDLSALLNQAFELCLVQGVAYEKGQESAIQEIGGLISLMTNILRRGTIQELSAPQLGFIIKLAREGKSTDIRLHAASLLGIVGQLPKHFAQNQDIGASFLEILASFVKGVPSVNLEVVAETVNSICDVYSEDDRHLQVQAALQLTNNLAKFVPFYTQQLSVNGKKLDPMAAEHAAEMLENLKAFVKYKRSLKI